MTEIANNPLLNVVENNSKDLMQLVESHPGITLEELIHSRPTTSFKGISNATSGSYLMTGNRPKTGRDSSTFRTRPATIHSLNRDTQSYNSSHLLQKASYYRYSQSKTQLQSPNRLVGPNTNTQRDLVASKTSSILEANKLKIRDVPRQ